MWFFKKNAPSDNSPSEEIELNYLVPMLKQEFEKEISEFSKLSSGYVESFESSKKEFVNACHILENYTGEPNVEDLWAPNINSIKTQKVSYTKTLERVINTEKEGSFDTSYGKFKAHLSYIEELISELLRINGMFKLVVMSYSNELGSFKKIFSNMEHSRDKLRMAIDSIEPQHRKYEELSNKIEGLYGILDETNIMNDNIKALSSEITTFESQSHGSLAEKLAAISSDRQAKLVQINDEIKKISLNLSGILMPIERAARKMDHSYSGGSSLVAYIEKPLENFKSESDYRLFNALLDSLEELLTSDKILLKGKETVITQINTIRASNLNNLVTKLGILEKERHLITDELFSNEQELKSKLSKVSVLEEKRNELLQIKKRIEDLKNSKSEYKANIEQLFFKYYNKRINIKLDN